MTCWADELIHPFINFYRFDRFWHHGRWAVLRISAGNWFHFSLARLVPTTEFSGERRPRCDALHIARASSGERGPALCYWWVYSIHVNPLCNFPLGNKGVHVVIFTWVIKKDISLFSIMVWSWVQSKKWRTIKGSDVSCKEKPCYGTLKKSSKNSKTLLRVS